MSQGLVNENELWRTTKNRIRYRKSGTGEFWLCKRVGLCRGPTFVGVARSGCPGGGGGRPSSYHSAKGASACFSVTLSFSMGVFSLPNRWPITFTAYKPQTKLSITVNHCGLICSHPLLVAHTYYCIINSTWSWFYRSQRVTKILAVLLMCDNLLYQALKLELIMLSEWRFNIRRQKSVA